MTLKQYADLINQFVKQNPEALEFDVIFACDDEGNNYEKVVCAVSKGYFSGWEYDMNNDNPNAVCIN